MLNQISIPGSAKRFCPHCSRAKDPAEFEPEHSFCRTCDLNRFAIETIRQNCADRRVESLCRLLWLLDNSDNLPDGLTSAQKRKLRNLVIDATAVDPGFRDTLLDDLQMLKARQERITHVSAAQDIEDVRTRSGLNI